MTPEQELRLLHVEQLLATLVKSDRYVMGRLTQFSDGKNIQFGTNNGTKIGTDVDQKIGFYGKAPIAKQTGVAQNAVNLHVALSNLGLISS